MGSVRGGTGCEQYDDCLTCPLPECILDKTQGVKHYKSERRNESIRQMCRIFNVKSVAEGYGVSVRTVRRALGGK